MKKQTTAEEIIKKEDIGPKRINKIAKRVRKAVKKDSGLQTAIALTLLLRILLKNEDQRKLVNAIVDCYDISVEDDDAC